jgi:hypothetical protein
MLDPANAGGGNQKRNIGDPHHHKEQEEDEEKEVSSNFVLWEVHFPDRYWGTISTDVVVDGSNFEHTCGWKNYTNPEEIWCGFQSVRPALNYLVLMRTRKASSGRLK